MDIYTYTNKGSRENNEDSIAYFNNEDAFCFLVCDGLGGHGYGEVASAFAINTFKEYFDRVDDYVNYSKDMIDLIDYRLVEEQRKMFNRNALKTTIVSFVITNNVGYVTHVGDSRFYFFNKNKYKWRTEDHSLPQMLASIGDIKEKEIRHHPDRNKLLKVLGAGMDVELGENQAPIELQKGQAFLLCTDGFWELINEKEMQKCLKKSKNSKEWLELMKEIVVKNGEGTNMDNFSAITIIV